MTNRCAFLPATGGGVRHCIDLSRLRAALAAGGFRSYNQLAKAADIAHTTLSRALGREIELARSRTAEPVNMNSLTFYRLVQALRVPERWLTGELDSLPFVPKHGLLGERRDTDAEDVTASKVRLSHLLTRADQALQRDLHVWYPREEAAAAYKTWGRGILRLIDELASPVTWRVAGVSPKRGDPRAYLSRDLWDNGLAISWLEQALKPWLDDRAYLNAAVLGELFAALAPEASGQGFISESQVDGIRRALRMYEASAAGAGRRRGGARGANREAQPRRG